MSHEQLAYEETPHGPCVIRHWSDSVPSQEIMEILPLLKGRYGEIWQRHPVIAIAPLCRRLELTAGVVQRWTLHETSGGCLALAEMIAPTAPAGAGTRTIRLYVAPHARRRRLGSRLLLHVLERAHRAGIESLRACTYARSCGGREFAEMLGARAYRWATLCEVGLPAAADATESIDTLASQSAVRVRVTGAEYPDEHVPAIARLRDAVLRASGVAVTDRPHDRMCEELRQGPAQHRRLGMDRLAFLALDGRNDVIGINEYVYDPVWPEVVQHAGVAVAPRHAKRGVGATLTLVAHQTIPSLKGVAIVQYTKTLPSHLKERSSCQVETTWRVSVAAAIEALRKHRPRLGAA